MKKYIGLLTLFTFMMFGISDNSYAQLNDLLKKAENLIPKNKTAANDETIVKGLMEALTIGSKNAVDIVSKVNGYYSNDLIKIPLPGEIQSAAKTGRKLGLGKNIDEFELSMNRAAESAAREATSFLWDAIKHMSFDDARKILTGRENEATLYFKDKTSDKLRAAFKPAIEKSMADVGVTSIYQNLSSSLKKLPFVKLGNTDLPEYVTGKALDGLFTMIAAEEKKIRTDPAARVTDLLKQVFGK